MEAKFLPINPTIIRVMRVARIARVLKLLKMAKGMRALLNTGMCVRLSKQPNAIEINLFSSFLFSSYASITTSR